MTTGPNPPFFKRLENSRAGAAAARFFDLLPALALASLCLRAAELAAGTQAGTKPGELALITAQALGSDLLSLARYLPVLFLYSLPFLLNRSRRSFWGLGAAWSLLVLLQAALVIYFFKAGVPLGSDLLGYSPAEILATIRGGGGLPSAPVFGLALALGALWTLLARQIRKERPWLSFKAAAAALAAGLVMLAAAPGQFSRAGSAGEYSYNLALDKTSFLLNDTAAYLLPSWLKGGTSSRAALSSGQGLKYLDPKYPFLRAEQTPDALGPYFEINPARPPNIVFIIVEGLGRSFSGPGAALGSFTPNLDRLAAGGLYWENFLATQGRTFGVLPSLLASLPFGDNGLAELGERMPRHISLLSVLKNSGYRLKVYSGFNSDFDNDRIFYARNGVDSLVDELNFGPGYQKSNSWGYADRELFSRVLAGEAKDDKEPFITLLKTATMHTPYTFLGQAAYDAVFERRLDQLGIPEAKKAGYRAYRSIYTSILYTDEQLGRFLEGLGKDPAYRNTIFVITGDHRLPEIPMVTRIDRYHVPLLIYSPLLKTTARIKSVSSQFDVTPSLLAFLSHNYGIRTPKAVTWLGTGLDLEPSFRNTHVIPMKQTKTNFVDFLAGTWYLNQDALYKLNDAMGITETRDGGARERMKEKFGAFLAANEEVARTLALMPEGTEKELAPYREEARLRPSVQEDEDAPRGVAVSEVSAPESSKAGSLAIEVKFSNSGPERSELFVPLVVLMTDGAAELTETYGPAQRLAPGETVSLKLDVKSAGIQGGRYFLAVIPSHPDTGKSIGAGRYRVPVRLQ